MTWDKIQDLVADVGIADKIFGTGMINARVAGVGGFARRFGGSQIGGGPGGKA